MATSPDGESATYLAELPDAVSGAHVVSQKTDERHRTFALRVDNKVALSAMATCSSPSNLGWILVDLFPTAAAARRCLAV